MQYTRPAEWALMSPQSAEALASSSSARPLSIWPALDERAPLPRQREHLAVAVADALRELVRLVEHRDGGLELALHHRAERVRQEQAAVLGRFVDVGEESLGVGEPAAARPRTTPCPRSPTRASAPGVRRSARLRPTCRRRTTSRGDGSPRRSSRSTTPPRRSSRGRTPSARRRRRRRTPSTPHARPAARRPRERRRGSRGSGTRRHIVYVGSLPTPTLRTRRRTRSAPAGRRDGRTARASPARSGPSGRDRSARPSTSPRRRDR